MMKLNYQEKIWTGNFGKKYSERNNYSSYQKWNNFYFERYGYSKEKINYQFLQNINKDIKILEIGCNLGQQLFCLYKMGFKNLYGIEIQSYCINQIRKNKKNFFNVIQASAYDIPFKKNYFDLVFTNNVLIHFPPKKIRKVLNEAYRVSSKWIWGFEYYSKKYVEILYRNHQNMLWKNDYANLFLRQFNSLKLKKKKLFINLMNNQEIDSMYLLKKK